MELTHASFFSGVGGLDLGLERAGWRTVSFSEIDPYANAVLAERWPGVPNLGDILALVQSDKRSPRRPETRRVGGAAAGGDWRGSTLWSGGFPCQGLSVAGKRLGLADPRSGLAYAFLDLVERHRPPAILLENVPGLLSSHGGKDFGALLGRLGQLRYWWAYRILDAQFFGVPQRRRRVFVVALHAGAGFGAASAAAVLSVGTRCEGHSAAGDEAGEGAARRSVTGVDLVGALDGTFGHHGVAHSAQSASVGHYVAKTVLARQGNNDDTQQDYIVSPAPDPGGNGTPHGMARRLDYRAWLEAEGIADATDEASAAAILRRVWPNAGAEAVQRATRGFRGISASEVLRYALHGVELRQAAIERGKSEGQDGQLSRTEGGPGWAVFALRQTQREGRTSPEREPERQPARESDAALPQLSSPHPHLASTLRVGPQRPQDGGPGDTVPIIASGTGAGWWNQDNTATGTLRADPGGTPTHVAIEHQRVPAESGEGRVAKPSPALLPLGLDSHRYRCCGNGVVAPVSEWIGWRLRRAVEEMKVAA